MDGTITIKTEIDNSDFDREIKSLEDKLEGLTSEYNTLSNLKPFEGQEKQMKQLSSQILSTKKRIGQLKKEQDKLNQTGFNNILKSINGVGNSINGVIKKVTKWGLAIFGIRSAYNAIRSAASTLSQYNEQIGTDIEYIRFALASALQPIVETLIRLAYKLLAVINSISVKLFNYPLFANATADGFNKTAKSAEKIKKSLAGFDEMNVLQDTSGGDTSGGVAPSIDLSKTNEEADAYVEKMKETVNTVTSFWEEDWKNYFDNTNGDWDWFIKGLLLTLEGFYKVFKGIFEVIGGIIDIFVGIFTGDMDKLKEGWDKLLKGFVDILVGIIDIIIGLIMALLGIIKGIVLELWKAIVGILSAVGGWIYKNVIKPVADFFVGLWNGIINGVQSAFNFIVGIFNGIVNFFRGIISTIVSLFKDIGAKVGDVIGGAFKAVVNGVLSAIENILNFPIKSINKLINVINKVPGINLGKLSTFNLPRLAKGGIINQPGRGVAIGGEAGREGVLPLTDSQQMAMLGEAIGKYITVDITNITNLDGRQIARKVEQINQNNRFVLNR